jgi:hypothetical protein
MLVYMTLKLIEYCKLSINHNLFYRQGKVLFTLLLKIDYDVKQAQCLVCNTVSYVTKSQFRTSAQILLRLR